VSNGLYQQAFLIGGPVGNELGGGGRLYVASDYQSLSAIMKSSQTTTHHIMASVANLYGETMREKVIAEEAHGAYVLVHVFKRADARRRHQMSKESPNIESGECLFLCASPSELASLS
jgi:hypothetical protein